MKLSILILSCGLITVTISSCRLWEQWRPQPPLLPTLSLRGEVINEAIIHRYPEYGDGNRDGCLVSGELGILLDSVVVIDSIIHLYGIAKDNKTLTPIIKQFISFYPVQAQQKFSTDAEGRFHLYNKNSINDPLVIYIIGFRKFKIDRLLLIELAAEQDDN